VVVVADVGEVADEEFCVGTTLSGPRTRYLLSTLFLISLGRKM
jgi:hypothetical protein